MSGESASSTKVAAPAIRNSWQQVLGEEVSSRSTLAANRQRSASDDQVTQAGQWVECGSENISARPGTANQLASPVNHSDTRTPAASAVAVTVNACEQRSGSSAPDVSFTTSCCIHPWCRKLAPLG